MDETELQRLVEFRDYIRDNPEKAIAQYYGAPVRFVKSIQAKAFRKLSRLQGHY